MNRSIRLDKRDLILAKGTEVMTRRGYHGAGVQEIVRAAGVPKGSFYHYFASKEDFAQQALEYLYAPRLQRYAMALADANKTPCLRIISYYRDLVVHFNTQEKREYHCFIASLGFEMAELAPAIGQQVERIFRHSVAILHVCLEEAQAAGEIAADEDCANLAVFIANAWQGALTRLKVSADTQALDAFIYRLQRMLQP